jgi:hypothetical protein
MNEKKPNFLVRIVLLLVNLVYGILNRVAGLFVNIIIFYAISYFGLMWYLNAHPEKKEMFEQKKAVIVGMMSQTTALLQAQQDGELTAGADLGALENISHLITPEMMQMAMAMMGGSAQDKPPLPPKELDLSALKSIDPNSYPSQLLPIVETYLTGRARDENNGTLTNDKKKKYAKVLSIFTIKNAGTDGAKAVPRLGKLLGAKNQTIAEGAYISLRLIGTEEAISVLKAHGYGQ